MSECQWHYTSQTYIDFLIQHADMTTLYVEGWRVEGVDVQKYLSCGIVREVVARAGELFIWTDFFALANARADEVLKKWLPAVPHFVGRDVELYLQTRTDQSVMEKVVQGKIDFVDDAMLLWTKACAGIHPDEHIHNEETFLQHHREFFIVYCKICTLLFDDIDSAKKVLSTFKTWCALREFEQGIPKAESLPTAREIISIFPGMVVSCRELVDKEMSRSYGLVLDRAEQLRIACDDGSSSREALEGTKPETFSEKIENARKWKVLFNDEEKVRVTLPRHPSECGTNCQDIHCIELAAAWRHLTGEKELAEELLRNQDKPDDAEGRLQYAMAWKNIIGSSKKAAGYAEKMINKVPCGEPEELPAAGNLDDIVFDFYCAMACYEILEDRRQAIVWAKNAGYINMWLVVSSFKNKLHGPHPEFIDWLCRSLPEMKLPVPKFIFGNNPPGRSAVAYGKIPFDGLTV